MIPAASPILIVGSNGLRPSRTLSPPPGVPLTVPHAPQSRVGLDQVLDLAIAKLRSMLPADAGVTTESVRFPFLGGVVP